MPVQLQLDEDKVVACLSGEIDHHLAKELREQIDGACQRMNPELLILDFGGVSFMDSSGIGLIMGRYRLMQELGGRLLVTNVPSTLKKVMQVAGLEQLKVLDNGGKQQ